MNSKPAEFSVHTFVISRPITWKMWRVLKDFYYSQAQNALFNQKVTISKKDGQRRELEFLKYRDKGVVACLKWIEDKDNNSHFHNLEVKINPRRLIGEDTYVGVFEFYNSDLEKLNEKLKDQMLHLGWDFSEDGELETFSLSRIDICMNFYVDEIDVFINAVRKCLSPKGFEKYLHDNKKIPKDGVEFWGTGMNVQIYNKYREMVKKGYEKREEELEIAKNLMRYEVQLFRPQIYKYIRKGFLPADLSGGIVKTFIAMGALSPCILLDTAIKFFGRSPYYTAQDMLSIIMKSEYKRKTRGQMIVFQDLTSKYNNADRALEELKKRKNKVNAKKLIKKFDDIGMNIIAIPENKDNDLQPKLPSIPELVIESIRSNYHLCDKLIQLDLQHSPEIHIPPYFHQK